MNTKKIKIEVSLEEKEFIELIRMYNKSFPNGYPAILWELERMFNDILKQPY